MSIQLIFKITCIVSDADRCLDLMSEGACSEYVLLWYFHAVSEECRPFVYGGCGGSQNRFSTRHECESVCGTQKRAPENQSDLTGGVSPSSNKLKGNETVVSSKGMLSKNVT
uniref:BPTI/Kunitz inhibitor domain-containing protein n=1 Tax=Oryzias melastigma TaxID=30732 RepID=A0A3B3DA78_ORYME